MSETKHKFNVKKAKRHLNTLGKKWFVNTILAWEIELHYKGEEFPQRVITWLCCCVKAQSYDTSYLQGSWIIDIYADKRGYYKVR